MNHTAAYEVLKHGTREAGRILSVKTQLSDWFHPNIDHQTNKYMRHIIYMIPSASCEQSLPPDRIQMNCNQQQMFIYSNESDTW